MRVICLLVCSVVLSVSAYAEFDRSVYNKLWRSVAKVRALTPDGVVPFGSAVVVARGKLITNCHVTRDARAIDVIGWGGEWRVKKQIKDIEHDLCLLIVGTDIGDVVELGEPGELRIGHEVAAIGYPGGTRMHFSEGMVRALHQYDGAKVIQTDAPFAMGQSGGALFDRIGRLVGILTFHSYARGPYYFSLPATWIKPLLEAQSTDSFAVKRTESFWERSYHAQPFFMKAATHEALKDWPGLKKIAGEWTQSEASNPEAWLALGKAFHHSHQSADAITALRNAVKLDPQHSEGWFYLGAAYRDAHEDAGLEEARSMLSHLNPRAARELLEGGPTRN